MRYELGARTGTAGIGTYEANQFLRVPTNPNEGGKLICDALDMVESETDCSLGTRTITATIFLEDVRCGVVHLPRGPVQSVTSCVDADGNAIETELRAFGKDDQLKIAAGGTYPLTVIYVAGYATAPGPLRRVALSFIADLYDNRTLVQDGQQKPWITRTLEAHRRGPRVG